MRDCFDMNGLKIQFWRSLNWYYFEIPEGKGIFELTYGPETLYLINMNIEHEFRGRGTGTQLYTRMEQWAIAHNYLRIVLLAHPFEDDPDRVRRFWLKQGFESVPISNLSELDRYDMQKIIRKVPINSS